MSNAAAHSDEARLRTAVARVCRRLWERGLVAGPEGNVSARLGPDRFLMTPTGFAKVDVTEIDLVVVSAIGEVVAGRHAPSSEMEVHLRAYAARPDVGGVVHAHPPTATGFAVAGEPLPDRVLPEMTVLLGPVPLVPYARPGTREVADRFGSFWTGHDVFLMRNHGALALGADVETAHWRMETLEQAACILLTARHLGRPGELSSAEVDALVAQRGATRPTGRPPARARAKAQQP